MLRARRSGDRIQVGGEIFRTRPDRPWGLLSPYTKHTGSFPGVKRPGRGVDHPSPSSAEVKERVVILVFPLYIFMAAYEVNCTYLYHYTVFFCNLHVSFAIVGPNILLRTLILCSPPSVRDRSHTRTQQRTRLTFRRLMSTTVDVPHC